MTTILYPVPGRLVRDPITGREVTGPTSVSETDPFWLRRLADGDVTQDAPKPEPSKGSTK